jgi:hypothetical protein
MIDTCMVLWNQGSRRKGIKVLFTFALICISLSLLLVTSIIPGWILLTRNPARTTTTHADSTRLSSVQSGNPATVIAATQIPVVSATASTVCATSTPHVGGAAQIGRRRQQASGVAGRPALSPSPIVVRASGQHANRGNFIKAHAIYSGRSSGALSHLHSSAPKEILPTPTMTLTPGTTATSPIITITPYSMHPHIARTGILSSGSHSSEEIVKANPTALADPLLMAGQIPQKCTLAHQG